MALAVSMVLAQVLPAYAASVDWTAMDYAGAKKGDNTVLGTRSHVSAGTDAQIIFDTGYGPKAGEKYGIRDTLTKDTVKHNVSIMSGKANMLLSDYNKDNVNAFMDAEMETFGGRKRPKLPDLGLWDGYKFRDWFNVQEKRTITHLPVGFPYYNYDV